MSLNTCALSNRSVCPAFGSSERQFRVVLGPPSVRMLLMAESAQKAAVGFKPQNGDGHKGKTIRARVPRSLMLWYYFANSGVSGTLRRSPKSAPTARRVAESTKGRCVNEKIGYVAAVLFALLISYPLVGFSLLGGSKFVQIIVATLVVAGIVAITFAVWMDRKGKHVVAALALASPPIVALGCLMAFAEGRALFSAYAPDAKFTAACERTGVRILNAPKSK